MKPAQPWLANPTLEYALILAPSILPVALVLVFQNYFTSHAVSTAWWIVLVLCVDVSHVYSTLFRLYWDRATFNTYKHLLVVIPVSAFIVALVIHLYDAMLFWRLLAYIAVYHFVRQQYGFMRLYARKESSGMWHKRIDAMAIYAATLYPLLYWHITGTDHIAWFVKGDFISLSLAAFMPLLTGVYYGIILIYISKETYITLKERFFNIPKNLIVTGTFLSWYVGIVAFQGDLIFTLLNVVAHGIPYMALVWIYGSKKASSKFSFGIKGVAIFISVLFLLAYAEENLWDNFVWNDHPEIFLTLSATIDNPTVLSVLVALLVLPQVTHYVLDGFIWKFSKDVHARI